MLRPTSLILIIYMQFMAIGIAAANDFDWLNNLNVTAVADSSGFRLRLATRFRIGDAQINAVIGNVDRPSDAYMIFRLGELSHRSVTDVMTVYRSNRKKGWGVIAKSLGIKPGSREFHALKQGHDLNSPGNNGMNQFHDSQTPHEHGNNKAGGKGNKKK